MRPSPAVITMLRVGRMSRSERYKGHDELLECWSDPLTHIPNVKLAIVGTGDDANRLREKAKGFGALARLLTDSKLRSAYGTAGRKRFEHEFTFEDDCARHCIVLETKPA
jgi:hypothetical protein